MTQKSDTKGNTALIFLKGDRVLTIILTLSHASVAPSSLELRCLLLTKQLHWATNVQSIYYL